MTTQELQEVLRLHKMWLNGEDGGKRAVLSDANLGDANLGGADLSGAVLSGANLSGADLSGAYLSGADLSGANLSGADLSGADLSGANLSGAYLSGAYLSDADLSGANLSGATGLIDPIAYIEDHFERTADGYIVYKVFSGDFSSPKSWDIAPESIITETSNFDRCTTCGCGINVAPLDLVRKNYPNKPVWRCLIRFEWLAGVCVPYNTDGKIRCSKLQLIESISTIPTGR